MRPRSRSGSGKESGKDSPKIQPMPEDTRLRSVDEIGEELHGNGPRCGAVLSGLPWGVESPSRAVLLPSLDPQATATTASATTSATRRDNLNADPGRPRGLGGQALAHACGYVKCKGRRRGEGEGKGEGEGEGEADQAGGALQ